MRTRILSLGVLVQLRLGPVFPLCSEHFQQHLPHPSRGALETSGTLPMSHICRHVTVFFLITVIIISVDKDNNPWGFHLHCPCISTSNHRKLGVKIQISLKENKWLVESFCPQALPGPCHLPMCSGQVPGACPRAGSHRAEAAPWQNQGSHPAVLTSPRGFELPESLTRAPLCRRPPVKTGRLLLVPPASRNTDTAEPVGSHWAP